MIYELQSLLTRSTYILLSCAMLQYSYTLLKDAAVICASTRLICISSVYNPCSFLFLLLISTDKLLLSKIEIPVDAI